jgi:hypothetical protein
LLLTTVLAIDAMDISRRAAMRSIRSRRMCAVIAHCL